ncbi:phosphotransferase [Nonomuraea sp. NPDC048882]|uniref:phosphotransferase n=1 Tax=Nonomuraea sp. NPDC048882 TaxID=3154347 RepID=UPI00340AFC18
MSGPARWGPRRDWADLPAPLVAEAERRLGAVRGFEPRRGGFSYGVLGVLTLDGGRRVFVKATPADADHAGDYRSEAVISAALPAEVPTPRLLFSCERDGWVLLCSEEAPGRVPHEPWRPAELAAALDLLTACAAPLTPAPVDGLPTVAERMAGRCELWHALATNGGAAGDGDRARAGAPGIGAAPEMGAWERAHLDRLAAVERTWTSLVTGDTLLHFDPRFDNIVIDAHGTARYVDWGRACVGPAWTDLVCLLLESDLGTPDPEEIFTAHPLGRAADPERVDALLVALAGYWTRTAALPGPAHAPHLQQRREHSRRATLSWLRIRWAAGEGGRDRGCGAGSGG